MKPLEIFCRNRVMYAQITVHDKSMGMKDYHLYNKNGLAFYVFRKSQGVWQLAFGVLADDIKEACIDALILRFDTDVPELFYHHGKRQLVEVRAKKSSLWHIYLNNAYVGSIQYDTFTKQFNYHLDDNGLLTDDHVQKYIAMIQRGELKWIKDDIR
ncbi:hypothetical protein ACR79Q_24300 [Sphingobacterium multivorum]|uniref:hypothetical protein n=1 Tax=Sphingobacterium multivorum TaxID=28454 RepID=UPI003DA46D59